MNTFEEQITPSSFVTYEQNKSHISDENLIRWVDRFLHKYALSCSYKEIEVQGNNRFFSKYSTLLGVFLAYQAFDDIAELNYTNGISSTKASHYISSNDLLHESIVSNTKLCEYLLKSSEKTDDAYPFLEDSLTSKSKNVVVFGYFIKNSFLKQDFTARNLGISKAIEKESMMNLRIYLNAISNHMFTAYVKSISKNGSKD